MTEADCMHVYLRCTLPHGIAPEDVVERVNILLSSAVTTRILGAQWFGLGGSRSEALRKPYALPLPMGRGGWKFTKDLSYWRLGLWNGRDSYGSIGITSQASMLSKRETFVVVTLWVRGRSAVGEATSWDEALELGKCIALRMGGECILVSSELVGAATSVGLDKRSVFYARWWEDGREDIKAGDIDEARILLSTCKSPGDQTQ